MMKHTKMLSTRVLIVLMVALLTIFAFSVTVFADEVTLYTIEFVGNIREEPVATVEDVDFATTTTVATAIALIEDEEIKTDCAGVVAWATEGGVETAITGETALNAELADANNVITLYVATEVTFGEEAESAYYPVGKTIDSIVAGTDGANYYWLDKAGKVVETVGNTALTLSPAKYISFYGELGGEVIHADYYPLDADMYTLLCAQKDFEYQGEWVSFADGFNFTNMMNYDYDQYRLAYDISWPQAVVADYESYYNTYIVASKEDFLGKDFNIYLGTWLKFYDNEGSAILNGVYPYGTKIKDIKPDEALCDPTVWLKEVWNEEEEASYLPATEVDHDAYKFYPGYEITFKADGKIVHEGYFTIDWWEADFPDTYADEPKVPNKVGYYGKWEPYSLEASDIVVNAQYTAKTYRIYFDANGGEGKMDALLLSYDKEKALTENVFTRTGYTFAGWNTKADGTGDAYVNGETVKNLTILGSTTLYAQWTENAPEIYTATFMANGSVVATVQFEAGATELSNVPEVPARDGYEGAWDAYTLGNKDITIQATYTAKTYEIAFNANGGEGDMENQIVKFDESVILKSNVFTKEGYTFAGWNTKADGEGIHFDEGATVKNLTSEGTITLYAEWEEVVVIEETTTEEIVTTAPVADESSNVGLIVGLSVVAGLAVIGGVVGYLIYKKKKSNPAS